MADTPNLYQLYQSLINDISQNTKQMPLISFAASKINRKPGEILLALLLLVAILTTFGFLGHYFGIFIACLLAAPRTLKSYQLGTINERNQWLTYWSIIGVIISLEIVLGGILSMIPFYDLGKLLLIVSLAYPKSNLANKFYEIVIRPKVLNESSEQFKKQ